MRSNFFIFSREGHSVKSWAQAHALIAVGVLILSFVFVAPAVFAETITISCGNLNNNPSAADCTVVETGQNIQDSQLANLVNDFDEIKACADLVAANTTGSCDSTTNRFHCDIVKDAGGNVTSANCSLNPNVPTSVFQVQCSTISSSDAYCNIVNNVSAIRSKLNETGNVIGKLLKPNELAFANSLLDVCDNQYGITSRMQSDCILLETMIAGDNPYAARFIEAITPDAASVAIDATQTSLRGVNRNIAQRMSNLRRLARMSRPATNQSAPASGSEEKKEEKKDQSEQKENPEQDSFLTSPYLSAPTIAHNEDQWRSSYHSYNGGGASADASNGQLGVFVNAMGDNGDKETSINQRGFKFNGGEMTAGVDYRVGASGFFGMAFGFTHSKTDIKDGRGNLANRAYNLILYGSVNPDEQSFVDVNLIVGGGQFEQDRIAKAVDPANVANSIDQVYAASYFSHQNALSFSMGYDLSSGSLSVSPYVGLTIMKSVADAYSESVSDPGGVGGGLSLYIDEQKFDSKTMTLGTQVSYASNHSWGVLMPQATFEWINETKGNAEAVKGHFVGDPGKSQFRLDNGDVDSVYYSIGLGCSAIVPGGNTVYGQYQTFIGYKDFRYSAINLGMRWEL